MPDQVFLTPDFGPRLQAAFAPLAPQLRLDGAKIGPSKAEATVCRADNTCFAVHFALAQQRCADTTAGSWCVRVADSTPAESAVLVKTLASLAPVTVATSAPPPPVGTQWPVAVTLGGLFVLPLLVAALWRRWRPVRLLWLLAVAVVLAGSHAALLAAEDLLVAARLDGPRGALALWFGVPVGLGAYGAACLRFANRGRLGATWSLPVLAAVGPLVAVSLTLASGRLGGWDALTMGAMASATLVVAGHRRFADAKKLALAGGVSLMALLVAEAAVRLLFAPPPDVSGPAPQLLHARSIRPDGVPALHVALAAHAMLYEPLGDASSVVMRLHKPPTQGNWVLHLGDSMVFGDGVAASNALPAQLAQLWQETAHINAGVPGTSLDVQLPLAWRLLQPHPPQLVVLHVMPGNDLQDLNQPNEACRGEPTLRMDPHPTLRCASPDWQPTTLVDHLRRSRPPIPVLLLSDVSRLARMAHVATHELSVGNERRTFDLTAAATQYQRLLAALQRSCADARATLVAVVWPLRASVYQQSAAPQRAALLRALAQSGIVTLDAQPIVDAWVQQGGEESVFLPRPAGDIHLRPEGLRRLAEWLLPQLQARL